MNTNIQLFTFWRDQSDKLLNEEDDGWDSWGQDGFNENKKNTQQTYEGIKQKEEDEYEAWLNDETPLHSMEITSKKDEENWNNWGESESRTKKSSKNSPKDSKKSSSKKNITTDDFFGEFSSSPPSSGATKKQKEQKEPLVGNLLDLGEDNSVSTNGNAGGWDNEVWANEDDEWRSLDIGLSENSKKK